MALVMNAANVTQQVRVHGAWFTFTPGQMKDMHEDKVYHLASRCAYMGFVALPEEFSDPEFKATEKGKKILEEARAKGVQSRCEYLEQLKANEINSLQRDIDKANLKYDSRLDMSPEMLKNFEELASYKKAKQNEAEERLKKIKELEKVLEGK